MLALTAETPPHGSGVQPGYKRRSKCRKQGRGSEALSLEVPAALQQRRERHFFRRSCSLSSNAHATAHLSLLTSRENPRRARAGGGATRLQGLRRLPLEKCASGGARRSALGRRAGCGVVGRMRQRELPRTSHLKKKNVSSIFLRLSLSLLPFLNSLRNRQQEGRGKYELPLHQPAGRPL